MTDETRGPRQGDAPPSRLAELLDCERQLSDLMTAAQQEARRRISDVRGEVAQKEAELEALLERQAESVRAEIRAESHARIRAIAARAREEVARFEGLSEADVARLAASAFRELLGKGEQQA